MKKRTPSKDLNTIKWWAKSDWPFTSLDLAFVHCYTGQERQMHCTQQQEQNAVCIKCSKQKFGETCSSNQTQRWESAYLTSITILPPLQLIYE